MGLKSVIYPIYKKCNDSKIVATLSHLYYLKLKKNSFSDKPVFKNDGRVRVAVICDEMTYRNFEDECDLCFVRPDNWQEAFKTFKPQLFLCESAWSGIDKYLDCWRCRVYRNHNVLFENRAELLKILEYCKENSIKTAFWNKEDPTFFGNKKYDFIDTALKFDYIFTTCAECIKDYKAFGAKNVYPLMFGFTPSIFNGEGMTINENCAVFAGSWYGDNPERCADMEKMFDAVLEKGIELRIYDRHYGDNNPLTTFPEKYSKYVNAAVPYTQLKSVLKDIRYAININTVKNSETMFARRVFEMMACGKCIISNDSLGMRKIFGDRVWFIGEDFDFEHIEEITEYNRKLVVKEHSFKARMEYILKIVEI